MASGRFSEHRNGLLFVIFLLLSSCTNFLGYLTFKITVVHKPLRNDSINKALLLAITSSGTIPNVSISSFPQSSEASASNKFESLLQPVVEITQQPSSSCRRVCNNKYQNVIILTPNNRAGSTDRFYLFYKTLQLAGYLCAQVLVPRPKFMLSPQHNQNETVSINLTWNDLGDFQFIDHPEIKYAIIDGRAKGSSILSLPSSPLVDWWNKKNTSQKPNPTNIFYQRRFRSWYKVITTNHTKIKSDFKRIERFSWKYDNINTSHIGFIWNIRANQYLWARTLSKYIKARHLPRAKPPSWLVQDATQYKSMNDSSKYSTSGASNPSVINRCYSHSQWQTMQPVSGVRLALDNKVYAGCEYSTIMPPTHVKGIQEKVRQAVMNQAERANSNASMDTNVSASDLHPKTLLSYHIGYFHVRRNDAIQQCNTSLEMIDQYLNCSFDTLTTSLSSSGRYNNQSLVIVVLLSSDERDTQYREAVARLIEQQTDRLRDTTNKKVRVISIDLDQLVLKLLDHEIQKGTVPEWRRNNFYVYETIFFLSQNRTMVQFTLEKHRSLGCSKCTNITQQISL